MLRGLAGFGLPLLAPYVYQSLGLGGGTVCWTFSPSVVVFRRRCYCGSMERH
jgi:hypothetical protein